MVGIKMKQTNKLHFKWINKNKYKMLNKQINKIIPWNFEYTFIIINITHIIIIRKKTK